MRRSKQQPRDHETTDYGPSEKVSGQLSRSPAEIQAAREEAVINRYINGTPFEKFTSEDRAVLTRHNILPPSQAMEGGHSKDDPSSTLDPRPSTPLNGEPIQNVTTQAELAVMLARHFHGRFKGDISEQVISDWKLGKRLRKGVPLPPAKERAYHIGQKWAQWLEEHILTDPRYRLGADNQGELDVHDRAYLAKSETLILEKEIKRVEFERTQGRYVTVEKARHTRRGMLKVALAKVLRIFEHDDTLKRAEWLRPKLSPAELQEFREFDQSLARAGVDIMIDDFQKGIEADPEAWQAKELAEGKS